MITLFSIKTFGLSRSQLAQNLDNESLNPYPKITGIFLKGSFQLLTEFHYPKISKTDPRSRILIYLSGAIESNIEELLRIGYHKYKFLEIAVMAVLKTKDVGRFIKFCTYNPFIEVLFCKTLTNENVLKSMTEVKKFGNDRLTDLHKYPLKVR